MAALQKEKLRRERKMLGVLYGEDICTRIKLKEKFAVLQKEMQAVIEELRWLEKREKNFLEKTKLLRMQECAAREVIENNQNEECFMFHDSREFFCGR